jgi:hypothetical protein
VRPTRRITKKTIAPAPAGADAHVSSRSEGLIGVVPTISFATSEDRRHACASIDAVLTGVELTAPIELADAVELDARIRPLLRPGTSLEVYHTHKKLHVNARVGVEILCKRTLEAT